MLADKEEIDEGFLQENEQFVEQLVVLCSIQGGDMQELLASLSGGGEETEEEAPEEEEPEKPFEPADAEALRVYRVRLLPGKESFENGFEILSIIDGHLAKAGTDKSKLLSATIYLTDIKTFGEMNAVWDALSDYDTRTLQMPFTAERIWQVIRNGPDG